MELQHRVTQRLDGAVPGQKQVAGAGSAPRGSAHVKNRAASQKS